jgi:hypothetical protein
MISMSMRLERLRFSFIEEKVSLSLAARTMRGMARKRI